MLVPFSRGDLVARVHAEGEVTTEEHTEHGTPLQAKVYPDLARCWRSTPLNSVQRRDVGPAGACRGRATP